MSRLIRIAHAALAGVFVSLCAVSAAYAQASSAESETGFSAETATSVTNDAGERIVTVPEPSEKALRYYRSGNVLWLVDQAVALLFPALLLFTGFSARMRDFAKRFSGHWLLVIPVYFLIYTVIAFVVDLPLSYYGGFVREHAYDLSNQTLQKWVNDTAISFGLSFVLGLIMIAAIYGFLRLFPRRWWLVLGLGSVPFLILFIFVMPIWIEPLYNDFRPMEDEAFEAEILALAERAGIEDSRVFVVEKSEDTKTVNAYVTGFGDTKRIVMWDTLLERLNEKQALFVLGHEMGHFVLGHIYARIAFLSTLLIGTLYLVHRTAQGLINRFKHRFGFDRLNDVASFPLIVLLMNVFLLVAMPLVLGFSRYQEREADRFGLELTRLNYEASTGFLELMDTNLLVPRPGLLFTLWRGTHPSMGDRVDFFNTYRPWETGVPLRYERFFGEE